MSFVGVFHLYPTNFTVMKNREQFTFAAKAQKNEQDKTFFTFLSTKIST